MLQLFSTFFYDLLREKHSRKYSTTKALALAAAFHLFVGYVVGLVIMYQNNEVDHVLLGEMSGLVLFLLGFKNFKSNTPVVGEDTEKELPYLKDNPNHKSETPQKAVAEEGVF